MDYVQRGLVQMDIDRVHVAGRVDRDVGVAGERFGRGASVIMSVGGMSIRGAWRRGIRTVGRRSFAVCGQRRAL